MGCRVELVTECDNILLLDPLHEGVWDSLVYAPFWDKYFSYVPGLVLQRYVSLLHSSPLRPSCAPLTPPPAKRYLSSPAPPSPTPTSRTTHATTV